MVVDLPAPFGPRNPNTSPRGTVRLEIVDGDDTAEPFGQTFDADGEIGRSGRGHRRYSGHVKPFRSRATDCRPDFPAHLIGTVLVRATSHHRNRSWP